MSITEAPPSLTSAFRPVPKTGVIYVTSEASKRGFKPADPDWCNLGQGQPETGPLPGSPPRMESISIHPDDQEYAPVAGLWELREAVASFYNRLYRRGMPSQYSAENVAICGGGRTSLTRCAAALGQVNLGHFLPDYTAYEELLDVFRLFSPIPILLEGERGYEFSAADLRREILGRGLLAILASNPCNPTGKLVSGDEMAEWVGVARDLDCTLLLDEFYSHYVWRKRPSEPDWMASAARYVEDVDRDPVVIFDGLTKNWRYPGWRTTWTVGPKPVIEACTSAGSFLDGGGSKPLQRAAIEVVTPEHAQAETTAIRAEFGKKREFMLKRARELGMTIDREPDGTFYVWARLDGLPAALSDGMSFFRAALEHKVITVPGEFFDVNPGKRRAGRVSRFRRHVRLSFGPSMANLEIAMDRIAKMVREQEVMLRPSDEVAAAVAGGKPVVALESTIVAHGLPWPENLEIGRALEAAVRAGGAVPATCAVLGGVLRAGLADGELEQVARAGRAMPKGGATNLAVHVARGSDCATTVSGTTVIAARAGIRVFATGGIGGVHRGDTGDVSSDLTVMAREQMCVVSAGAKAILDLPRTLETLETLGVLVLGYRTRELPAFYTRSSGLPLEHSVDDAAAAAAILRARWALGGGGVLLANPIPEAAALDPGVIGAAIDAALAAAEAQGIRGKALTPFLLGELARTTGGRAVVANRALALNNAEVAAAIACTIAV